MEDETHSLKRLPSWEVSGELDGDLPSVELEENRTFSNRPVLSGGLP
jgi:hypothetical protein